MPRWSYDLGLWIAHSQQNTVTCPAGQRVTINPTRDGSGRASFKAAEEGRRGRPGAPTRDGGGRASFKVHCATCPMCQACTKSRSGRTITVHPHEGLLQQARTDQQDPGWAERYRANRPIVERKIAHFVRRGWGGRNARTRGKERVATDLDTRAGALNWARLAALGLNRQAGDWTVAGA